MADRDYDPNAPEEKKDVVKVKAIAEGFLHVLKKNAGDVFYMDTKFMRCYPPKMKPALDEAGKVMRGPDGKALEVPIGGPIPEDATIVTTPRGEFELPPWVVVAPPEAVVGVEVGAAQDTAGHRTTFGKSSGSVL